MYYLPLPPPRLIGLRQETHVYLAVLHKSLFRQGEQFSFTGSLLQVKVYFKALLIFCTIASLVSSKVFVSLKMKTYLSRLYIPYFPCFYSTWQELFSVPWAQACRIGAWWHRQTRGASSASPPTFRPASFERQGCPPRSQETPPDQKTLDLCERNNLRSPASAAHVNFLGLFPTWTLYSLTIKITFGCPSHPIPLVAPRCNIHLRWCLISTAEQCLYRVQEIQSHPIRYSSRAFKLFA